MGLAIPLHEVYDWLAGRGLAGIEPPAGEGRPQVASAQRNEVAPTQEE
jgi:hypothetical protein